MTQANATTPDPGPVFPPGRYGRRRARLSPDDARRRRQPRGRWVSAVFVLIAVAAGLGVAWRLHDQYGAGSYDTQLVRFTDVTDSQVVVQFRVNLPAGRAAVCTVRARNRAGTEVGRAQLSVPAGPSRQPLVTYRLATSERPVTGEIRGCAPG